jgi:Ca-activated chloride channel family protein
MEKFLKIFLLCAVAVFVLGAYVEAKQEESGDKTLSPYFFVKSDDPNLDQLPLKSTSANVNISGVIADVKVIQVYKNEGKHTIEAIYVFPASTRAAVYGMKMTIGERTIIAKIDKRDAARKTYEDAKKAGKSASLLEQQRPNVFQMNVANILPGDEIKVELNYTELLVPTDKTYEFVYPTVVGPRYSNQSVETALPSDKWIQNPYLHQGKSPTYNFDISVNIAAGLPIQKVYCTSHKTNVNYDGPASALIKLDKSETNGGNRDYILKYRLDGEKIESGLLLYKGEKENFFLLMMQPPKRVTLSQIPGREYIFIVDVSGSMHGFPLDISKKLLKDLISNLRPTDTFNVLLFSGGSSLLSEQSLAATPENINKAIYLIEHQQGGGGTELLPALKKALSLKKSEGYARTIVIATDGYVSIEAEAFDLIRNNLDKANMFAFGIGSSVNRHLIEGMARVGMGEPFIITKPEEAPAKAEKFRKLIQSPVLTQIKMDFGKFEAYDVEPLSIPDVLAERPVIVFGKWRGKPQGTITLKGISGEKSYVDAINVSETTPAKTNSALQYLWARHKIALLSDYNALRPDDKRVEEVTNLGLKYNLLTAYTSFVAVDSEVRNKNGNSTTVQQPLPLPEGVSDYAVGNMPASASFLGAMKFAAVQELESGITSDVKKAKGEESKIKSKIISVAVSDQSVKATIQKNIEARVDELKNCAKNQHGNIVIELVMDQNGKIKTAVIKSIEISGKDITSCLVKLIKKWQFTEFGSKGDVKAVITLAI